MFVSYVSVKRGDAKVILVFKASEALLFDSTKEARTYLRLTRLPYKVLPYDGAFIVKVGK